MALCPAVFAQDAAMPHVSQIRAESRNNLIRITWMDSPDARGPVYIFRSARPFRGAIPPNSRPVVVRYGEQYYIDDTDDIGNLYYFIAASDVSGRRFDIIIPQTNSTNVNLASAASSAAPSSAAAASPASAAQASTAIASEEKPAQGITNIRARREGDRVIISFDILGPRKNAVLYRSMQPIRQPVDLINAVIVRSGQASVFEDFPVPGLSWYYAVVFQDEISSGGMKLRYGSNATSAAVLIPDDGVLEKPLRPIPLPVMTLHNTLPESFFLEERTVYTPLSAQTQRMLKNTQVPPKAALSLKRPRVFAVDLLAPTGGEESALFEIVKEYFEKRDWDGARMSLLHYLSLPRSTDVEARARFYLGQTLYFTGNYKGALFEFLAIKSVHPAEANNWIDAVLAAMVN